MKMKDLKQYIGIALATSLAIAAGVYAKDDALDYSLLVPKTNPRLATAYEVDSSDLERMTLASAKKSNDGWFAKPTISSDGKEIGVQVGLRYTGGPIKEFLWGASRPLHLYNHDEHTGKLEHIFMDTDLCCHVYAYFKLNNTGKIYFYNFDKSILNSVHINNTYTFYLEPYPELPGPTSGNCFWVQVIYRIIDENGSTVWESRWW